jgi:hypothetical protein
LISSFFIIFYSIWLHAATCCAQFKNLSTFFENLSCQRVSVWLFIYIFKMSNIFEEGYRARCHTIFFLQREYVNKMHAFYWYNNLHISKFLFSRSKKKLHLLCRWILNSIERLMIQSIIEKNGSRFLCCWLYEHITTLNFLMIDRII